MTSMVNPGGRGEASSLDVASRIVGESQSRGKDRTNIQEVPKAFLWGFLPLPQGGLPGGEQAAPPTWVG